MHYINEIRRKAVNNPKNIILPEGSEDRVIQATKKITRLGIAHITLLGDEKAIQAKLGRTLIKEGKVEIINPRQYKNIKRIASGLHAIRKRKGMKLQEAKRLVTGEPIYFAAMMVRLGLADGFVAGSAYTTPNVAKAAIQCLEKEKGVKIISGAFIVNMKDPKFGRNGNFIFADCAIVPNPDYKQLAEIAIVSARLAKSILGMVPRVAMLSYSTKGSAKGELVEKVKMAKDEAKKMDSSLDIDGELQLDAAIIPEVARIKAPKSKVAGKANVLIFPNLDSGNISYKLTQRLADAKAIGPILQGLSKPCSDLSRGCSVDDIVDTVAVTCVRAQ